MTRLRCIALFGIARVLPARSGRRRPDGGVGCMVWRADPVKRPAVRAGPPPPEDCYVHVAAALLLASIVVMAGVLALPPAADPFGIARDRIGAGTELPNVTDPHARGEDVCLRSLPPDLPDMELRWTWRICEPWELETKTRRAHGADAAVPPPQHRR